ncbi:MAG TPA: metallophosphoesterase [Nitrososphaeraceae archaeon]|nr:metallophosphoesterase [Nitrososphaeraceae archaeon]
MKLNNYNIVYLIIIIVTLSSMLIYNTNFNLKRDLSDQYETLLDFNSHNKKADAVEFSDTAKNSFEYIFDISEYLGFKGSKNITGSDNGDGKNDTKSIIAFKGSKNITGSDNGDGKNDTKSIIAFDRLESNDDDENSESKREKESNHKSDFNFVAVGDWDCKSETKDTVENILDHDPEVVLALGDLSYNGKAECWLDIIEPISEKTKIAIGNHETDSSKILRDYMQYFDLEKQYYSFNYKNVHFIGLSTEIPYEEGSKQYEFVVQDLKKYSKDPSIDWIVAFFHRQAYSSGGGPDDEDDFTETYHPLFGKFNVVLALQGHFHAYERSYPITFNSEDEGKPIVTNTDPNTYINPKGTIFVTAGTGGAHDMKISKSKPYSAFGLDGEFGIVNISVENDGTVLKSSFIENNGDEDEYDQFEIIKEKMKNK